MSVVTNILVSCSSLGGINFKEGIDLSLVCAAFDQKVNLIFVDAGINNLIKGQSSENLGDKNHVDIVKGLEFYDIDNIILEQETLDKTCLKSENLISSIQIKTMKEINELNFAADNLVVF